MAVDKGVDSAQLDLCLTAEADAIRQKTGGAAELEFDFDGGRGFADAIAAITGGGAEDVTEGVRFIGHDGRLLDAWPVSEVAGKTELPSLPQPETITWGSGSFTLTAAEWNWTLTQIQSYMANHPNGRLTVGCCYDTPDHGAYICITVPEGRLSVASQIRINNGSWELYWGDEYSIIVTNNREVTHTYAAPGRYIMHFSPLTETSRMQINGGSNGTFVLRKSQTTSTATRPYAGMIEAAYCGSQSGTYDYAFSYCCRLRDLTLRKLDTRLGIRMTYMCYSLKSVTVPTGVDALERDAISSTYSLRELSLPGGLTLLDDRAVYNAYSLAAVCVPDGVTTISQYGLYGLNALETLELPTGLTTVGDRTLAMCNLQTVKLPASLTSLGSYLFADWAAMVELEIPATVTDLGTYTFYNCVGLGRVVFRGTTPPTSASTVWSSVPRDCQIYVPRGSLSAYTSASGYPSSSTYTYVEYDV